MRATVYGIPGSHPVKSALLMLDHKGIEHRVVQVPPVLCRPALRAMGFPGPTVPAVRIDGRRFQTTRAIARELDQLRPHPPLFPDEPGIRADVVEAEGWGDEVLQPVARRLAWATLRRDRSGMASFFDGPMLGLSPRVALAGAGPIVAVSSRINSAGDAAARADVAALPRLLDHVDALLTKRVIGAAQPNAADFQIAPSTRLMMLFDDLKPALEGRPAARHATRVLPHYSGHMPAALPPDWLTPLS
ncbi:MAG: glutathione S-transferase N-terminal domain-containing protein [Thermoleophilaceae bacterium]|nr:glutathione S-transferase N-terminal domain-containing protein [Thermoleophilaceae bacterium]